MAFQRGVDRYLQGFLGLLVILFLVPYILPLNLLPGLRLIVNGFGIV